MSSQFTPLEIPDVLLVRHDVCTDARGFLLESFKRSAFQEAGIREPFVQLNRTHSIGGVLRGLHYQHPPAAQGKLVHVIRGEIFDVAVDLRVGSPTYAKWTGRRLSDQYPESVYVPPGFAHGYCTLSKEAGVVYLVTAEYSPAHEAGIVWDDEGLSIRWPIRHPLVSERDAELPSLQTADIRFAYSPSSAGRPPERKSQG